jgi:hypothetical protein
MSTAVIDFPPYIWKHFAFCFCHLLLTLAHAKGGIRWLRRTLIVSKSIPNNKENKVSLVRSVNFALSFYHLCAFVRPKPTYARNSVRFNPVLTLFYKEILASKVLQRESTICGQLGCHFFSRHITANDTGKKTRFTCPPKENRINTVVVAYPKSLEKKRHARKRTVSRLLQETIFVHRARWYPI